MECSHKDHHVRLSIDSVPLTSQGYVSSQPRQLNESFHSLFSKMRMKEITSLSE